MNISDEFASRISQGWCKGFRQTTNCTNCNVAYTGDECEIDVLNEDMAFVVLLIGYQGVFILSTLFIVLWIIFGYIARMSAQKIRVFGLTTFILYLNVLFCLVRLGHYFDPYGIYRLVPEWLDSSFIWMGLICIVTSCVICVAIWLDLIIGVRRMKQTKNFQIGKTVTVLLGGSFFALSAIILIIFNVAGNLGFGINLLNILFLIVIIVLVIITFCVVPRILHTFKEIESDLIKLKKVVRILKAVISLSILSLLIGVVFILVNTFIPTNKPSFHWIYYTIALIARLTETSAAVLLNLIVIDTPLRTIRVIRGISVQSKTEETQKPSL
eukprot:TRINITY_DN3265_c0_g1_i2.p1 TRINITY_DN3265_c0_g1~~TRINITY_DN3265_c0_g1_i2.p1  ORF type:complete len:327 (+),score=24.89 TRINITY_DN3265_c0_g1_i2:113-1093(+)